MRIIKKAIIALTILQVSIISHSIEDITIGAGMGGLYSGMGLNVGIKSQSDFKYVSAGLAPYASRDGNTYATSMGYVNAGLIDANKAKHAIHVYMGFINNEIEYNYTPYMGTGYLYFFNGIRRNGGNLGITFMDGNKKDGLGFKTYLQLGYQF